MNKKKKIKKEDKNMTKRMKRIAALLTCGLVLASGTSVYAGNAEGTLLGYPISLEVSVRKASAMTAGSYPKTSNRWLRLFSFAITRKRVC